MIFAIAALLLIGIFFIYSAVNRNDDMPVAPFYEKQMVWALVGLCFFLMLVLIDYHRFRDAAWGLYAVGVVLLILVLIPGVGQESVRRVPLAEPLRGADPALGVRQACHAGRAGAFSRAAGPRRAGA